MPALGEEFRSAREARGLTLSDVAERLHIRSVYLAAIEEEDWSTIGAPVYVRGFMRTYARFLGLDPEDVVARFAAAAAVPLASARPVAVAAEERPGGRRGPSAAAILALLVAVAAVAYAGYAFFQSQAGPSPALPVGTAASPSPVALSEATAAAIPSVEPSAAPTAAASAARGRELTLRLTQTSWLRVTVDGTVALEGTFPPGTAKTFHGTSALVRVGNAGGVQIAVDGRPVGPLGGDGDVVERRFVLAGE